MGYDDAALGRLTFLSNARDRTGYYEQLIKLGDPYGALALGVVKQSNLAGRVARGYAISVSRRYCRPIDDATWLRISDSLMRADLLARGDDRNFIPGTPSLQWQIIRNYHTRVFDDEAKLPPETWTAWIPLQIEGEAKAPKLWNRMLTEDFVMIGVQTAWLACGRALRANGAQRMQAQLLPQLQSNPPAAGGPPPDAASAACLARLAPWQLTEADRVSNERLALFYLSALADDPAMFGRLLLIAPTSAWRGRPNLVSPAY